MKHYEVNQQKVFYNYLGELPPITMGPDAAVMPPSSATTHPKLLTDTTLRDGSQDPHFALFLNDAKLKYYDLLHDLDNGTGHIEQIEVFIYQKRDIWVLDALLDRGYEYPQVTTWTRALPKDIKSLGSISKGRIKETGMLASSSDHHIFDKLKYTSKEVAIERYIQPIMTACEYNIRPRVHLEDTTKADVYGFVIPFMQRVLRETNGWAKFRVCDTIGWGSPDPYASLPIGIPKLISTLIKETGAELEFHGHNDFGMATANTMAALAYGCKRANVAFAGLGERSGNTSLEQVLVNSIRLYGDPGFRLKELSEIRNLLTESVIQIPAKQPIIGDVFATQAGIHQSGVSRQNAAEGGLIYLPFDARIIGDEAKELNLIGALSGMDGIVEVLNRQVEQKTGRKGTYKVSSRAVKSAYDNIQNAYDGSMGEDGSNGPVNQRRTFFYGEEILSMVREAESNRRPRSQ